ncbi:MAG TPA: DUF533 domain-containing protein [Candidatus Avidesulfovibrio excrementigallinarum]|nr:DUF533 domain-containing protein [Candidatus Avidesulfovibrio excrementigallinarum]
MSLFDVLKSGSFTSALETLKQSGSGALETLKQQIPAGQAQQPAAGQEGRQAAVPGGVGGLLGAGMLGALVGSVVSSDLVKNAALVGAGAIAWNFYQKWSAGQNAQPAQQPAQPQQSWPGQAPMAQAPAAGGTMTMQLDPTAELVMRTMTFAARADGNIDAVERQRIDAILQSMLPGQDVSGLLAQMQQEQLDPARIAAQARSAEQAEDLYRLSCAVIDIDHFMERGYLDALARALQISDGRKAALEAEAHQARQQLMASLSH